MNKLYQVVMTARLSRKGYRALCANPLYRACARGLTFAWFGFTLLWFWSNWTQLGGILSEASMPAFVTGWIIVFVAATLLLSLLSALQNANALPTLGGEPFFASRYTRVVVATAMTVTIVAFSLLLDGPPPNIVYKNF